MAEPAKSQQGPASGEKKRRAAPDDKLDRDGTARLDEAANGLSQQDPPPAAEVKADRADEGPQAAEAPGARPSGSTTPPGPEESLQSPAPAPNPEDESLVDLTPGLPIYTDPEIDSLVPPLTTEEMKALKKELREDGKCTAALDVWDDDGRLVLLDGKHRRVAALEMRIPCRVRKRKFPNREAAIRWVVEHQWARRHLKDKPKAYLRGKRYEAEKRQGARSDLAAPQNAQKSAAQPGEDDESTTAKRLAEEYGVNEATIRRDAEYARNIDAITDNTTVEFRRAALSGKLKHTREQVAGLAAKSAEEQKELVTRFLEQGKWDKAQRPKRTWVESHQQLWEKGTADDHQAFLVTLLADEDTLGLVRQLLAEREQGPGSSGTEGIEESGEGLRDGDGPSAPSESDRDRDETHESDDERAAGQKEEADEDQVGAGPASPQGTSG